MVSLCVKLRVPKLKDNIFYYTVGVLRNGNEFDVDLQPPTIVV